MTCNSTDIKMEKRTIPPELVWKATKLQWKNPIDALYHKRGLSRKTSVPLNFQCLFYTLSYIVKFYYYIFIAYHSLIWFICTMADLGDLFLIYFYSWQLTVDYMFVIFVFLNTASLWAEKSSFLRRQPVFGGGFWGEQPHDLDRLWSLEQAAGEVAWLQTLSHQPCRFLLFRGSRRKKSEVSKRNFYCRWKWRISAWRWWKVMVLVSERGI